MSQKKWAGFDKQRPISLKGAGIQNSWTLFFIFRGLTSSTPLNSCSFQRYRLPSVKASQFFWLTLWLLQCLQHLTTHPWKFLLKLIEYLFMRWSPYYWLYQRLTRKQASSCTLLATRCSLFKGRIILFFWGGGGFFLNLLYNTECQNSFFFCFNIHKYLNLNNMEEGRRLLENSISHQSKSKTMNNMLVTLFLIPRNTVPPGPEVCSRTGDTWDSEDTWPSPGSDTGAGWLPTPRGGSWLTAIHTSVSYLVLQMLIIIGRFFIQEIIMQWYRYQYSQVLEFEQYGGRSLSTGKQHFLSAYKKMV